jgi:glycosyltransferase involved in cell wall biosynthesis
MSIRWRRILDEVVLCVPVRRHPSGDGTAIRSANVRLAPLPDFDGPVQFYPSLAGVLMRSPFVRGVDLLHCRVPTPAAVFAFAFARLLGRPSFLLVVGDLKALLPTMPYTGVKRTLWRAYTAFEEWNVQWMVNRSLTFANGAALAAKHRRTDHAVIQTQTTTIDAGEIGGRDDTCGTPRVRLLTVSRIDPRKGLRILPDVVREIVSRGFDATIDIVGPAVGAPGEAEREQIVNDAPLGVGDRVRFVGPAIAQPADAALQGLRPVRAADPSRRRDPARAAGSDGRRSAGGDDARGRDSESRDA